MITEGKRHYTVEGCAFTHRRVYRGSDSDEGTRDVTGCSGKNGVRGSGSGASFSAVVVRRRRSSSDNEHGRRLRHLVVPTLEPTLIAGSMGSRD